MSTTLHHVMRLTLTLLFNFGINFCYLATLDSTLCLNQAYSVSTAHIYPAVVVSSIEAIAAHLLFSICRTTLPNQECKSAELTSESPQRCLDAETIFSENNLSTESIEVHTAGSGVWSNEEDRVVCGAEEAQDMMLIDFVRGAEGRNYYLRGLESLFSS